MITKNYSDFIEDRNFLGGRAALCSRKEVEFGARLRARNLRFGGSANFTSQLFWSGLGSRTTSIVENLFLGKQLAFYQ